MLQKLSQTQLNVLAVINSIKDDPDFNMNSWEHCICGHAHKVLGYGMTCGPTAQSCGQFQRIAADFLGLPNFDLFHTNPSRDEAINELHALVLQAYVDA
ncbi:MAG: hypothetical protein MN733_03370 [Nitrososphaera sp.]|nr:hypothetical protein [Nitrososphaera sp.]